MKALIIYTHPWEKSYNHAVLQTVVQSLEANGHEIDIIDLYLDNFNPVLPASDLALYSKGECRDPKIKQYQERLNRADHLFFIFPVWWYDLPAILKGFLDRVLLKGWAYEYASSGIPKGLLGFVRTTTVISTMKSPAWYYRLLYNGAIKAGFIKGTLKFCGLKKIKWFNICNIEGMGKINREKRLKTIETYISKTIGP